MNQAIAVFRAMPGVDIKILSYFLMSETIQIWAKKRAKATAGQFNLTLEICRDLPIPIPPKEEQIAIKVEIEKTYSIAEKSNTFIKTNIKRAEALRQSILKKAFSGKLIKMENNHDSGQR
jgi:type I restriction enzyme S subunit